MIVPKRFKKQTNRRQADTEDSDGSLEEFFLSTGVFQRSQRDRIRSDSQPELRRAKRQSGNCVAVLRNDCEAGWSTLIGRGLSRLYSDWLASMHGKNLLEGALL